MIFHIGRAALALAAILILQACQDTTTGASGTGSAETPAAAVAPARLAPPGTFAPKGMEGATVVIRPSGKAIVTVVDGYPARIIRSAGKDAYDRVLLPPGEHVLHVTHVGAAQGLNLGFEAEAGDYYAAGIEYIFKGEKFWAPVILRDSPEGVVVADKDGALVGKTLAEARKHILVKLAAAAKAVSQPATAESEPAIREDVARQFEEGRKLFGEKKYAAALAAFDAVLSRMPELDVALLYRGLALARMKRREEALAAFDAAVAAGQKNRKQDDKWFALPHYQRAVLLASARRFDDAEKAFDDSIAAQPTVEALAGRGNLLLAKGQLLGKQDKWDEAEPFFRGAQADAVAGIGIEPGNVTLWSMKTITHIMLNEHEQACESMRKACELGNCSILDQFPQCKPGGS